jgi:hypothetical protein
MGMDYAFLSTSVTQGVAKEFAGSAAKTVLFEVEYDATCPGADISMLSLFPGEKEVLFAPCTGLSLRDGSAGATGPGAGQARAWWCRPLQPCKIPSSWSFGRRVRVGDAGAIPSARPPGTVV